MRVLFLSTRPEKPSYRFRVAPFLAPLAALGWTVESSFVPRSWWVRQGLWRRLDRFDVVVVQKRLFGRFDLAAIRRRARRLVYDLDDAVMVRDEGEADEARRAGRFRAMARAADLVVAGNAYLAGEATRAGARRVEIVPTVVDTELYRPAAGRAESGVVTIGWSGSSSTNRYLSELLAGIQPLRTRTPWRFLAVSDRPPELPPGGIPVDFAPWSEAAEIPLLQSFDVGIMPLDDTPWSRGKCGLKAILAQAVGAPVVCSPVGVNSEILVDGETGFLARTPAEWTERLERLVEDSELRRRLGDAGRRRAVERWSVASVTPRLAAAISG